MAVPEVKSAGASIRENAIGTIVLGFAADPMARWAWPESSEYLRTMPRFVNAFGGQAFEHGTAYVTEAARAAALWLPPGVEPDEAEMGAIMEKTLRLEIAEDIGAVMKGMAEHQSAQHFLLRTSWLRDYRQDTKRLFARVDTDAAARVPSALTCYGELAQPALASSPFNSRKRSSLPASLS